MFRPRFTTRLSCAIVTSVAVGFCATPGTASACVTPAIPVTVEAEDATLAGGAAVETEHPGYFGRGYVGQFTDQNKGRAAVTFAVTVPGAGDHELELRYANGTGVNMTVSLHLGGTRLSQLVLPSPGSWATWTSVRTTVALPAGTSNVGYRFDQTDSGNVNLDRLTVRAIGSGRGATVPYLEYEAEAAATNGAVIGPDRTFRTVAAEASGRRFVRLAATGNYVEFTLTAPTNSVVVRYSIPDSPDGAGITAPIAIYADGSKLRDLELTSVYSWVYGAYPYGNDPTQGGAQRFFGESRTLLNPLPAGTRLRLQKDPSSTATYYDIDLIDTESVGAPLNPPQGFVDIRAHGAIPGDGTDDTATIRSAIGAARTAGTGVWIPQGTFTITDRIDLQSVAVRGAGPWYSVLKGRTGKGGFFATGGGVTIADLMIDGDVRYRDDANFHAALEGNFGTGSLIRNVWIEHTKVGLWADNGTDGLLATGLRIRNVFADGVNLRGNVRNTRVEQSVIRNTGDDAMAMWSDGTPVTNSSFAFNTIQIPMLGNGIGIYGGNGNRAEDNLIADTLTASAGIAVSTRFNPVPFSGETLIQRNTLLRNGGYEPNWQTELGALWIFADTSDITAPITVRDLIIRDTTYQAILISFQRRIENLAFDHVTIDTAGTYGIQINATGSATFSHVTIANARSGGLTVSPGFTVIRGPGNIGF